jgi:hypothetical protein
MPAWVGDGHPPFPGPPVHAALSPAAQARADQSLEERFEVEAMPHLNDLFRTALRMTGERGQAEDVVQEVYLQAWRSFERFEAGTNCRAWLYKILFRCVIHQRRKWFRFPLLKEKRGIPGGQSRTACGRRTRDHRLGNSDSIGRAWI